MLLMRYLRRRFRYALDATMPAHAAFHATLLRCRHATTPLLLYAFAAMPLIRRCRVFAITLLITLLACYEDDTRASHVT